MAKRKEETPPPGSPAWMATFGDLMNLLLCFFVLLFSMSTIDEEKYNQLVAAMSSAFSILDGGAMTIGDGILIGQGVSQLNELDQYINSTGRAADDNGDASNLKENDASDSRQEQMQQMQDAIDEYSLNANEELAERIEEIIRESNMADQIEVSFDEECVLLNLKGALLFDSGSAELRAEAYPILERVALILERYAQSTIEIEGHTDTVPMHSDKYANNEELSSGRALSVFDYLIEHTSLDPAIFKHSGRGERVPIADNSTEEGRARNRRVEIRIYNPLL